MKKKIIHIIFNLGRGGAETMLVKVVGELHEYENIVITLFSANHFKDELKCQQYYTLDLKLRDLLFFPLVVLKLRTLFKKIQPDLIHTHLYWPTVLTRLAAPANFPVITTIHSFVSQLVDYKKWYFRWFDRFTYKTRRTTIIAVARGALEEYFSFLRLKPHRNYCLYTFVDTRVFRPAEVKGNEGGDLKLVTVGALRYQKNHAYLLRCFRHLNGIHLDIYGSGPLKGSLEQYISEHLVSGVTLKGEVKNIQNIIGSYDIFVMPSLYEGFSLSVLEAMAMRIPLLLSDIPSFREQCEDHAVYFDPNDEQSFVRSVEWMRNNRQALKEMTMRAEKRVHDNFTLEHHLDGLRKIYTDVMDNS